MSANDSACLAIKHQIKTEELDWIRESSLVLQLHEIKQKEFGAKQGTGRPKAGEKVWGVRDTAEYLDMAVGMVSEDLMLAKHAKGNNELRDIKERAAALRYVRNATKKETEQASQDFTKRLLDALTPNQILFGSTSEVLKIIPNNYFDSIIGDLQFLEKKSFTEHQLSFILKEFVRVLKPCTISYFFVPFNRFYNYYTGFLNNGCYIPNFPVYWRNTSNHDIRFFGIQGNIHPLLMVIKTPKELETLSIEDKLRSNIFEYADAPNSRKHIFPYAKPIDLIIHLLEEGTQEDDIILDPFGGAPSIAEACKRYKRKYIVIEEDESNLSRIKKVLDE